MGLMETCDKCFRETPVEFMNWIGIDAKDDNSGYISVGIERLIKHNLSGVHSVRICDFCLMRCQQCGMRFLSHEGFISCDLDDDGFLTGEEIVLCPTCISIEDGAVKTDHAGNAKSLPCLSNTTNSFKNDALDRFDSDNEASSE